ncbi:uncharacterized protein LOC129717571 [Wyeomyia smithii]|uniref:uncharacterized protein LOC129717571 n=1 Tax=Wyeomyia smithii TaxID=174621 RepID=UPI002467DC36|nr:uncharacterized protein LOC129717571 [Wyeomyia smithii]
MSSKQIRHLGNLSPQERESFVQSFDCVIFDCDGVLWTVFEPIPGVAEALAALRAQGKTLRYITNNGVRSFEHYAAQFRTLGVNLEASDIIHPALSVVRHLQSINFQGLIYCIATETFKTVLREAGYELLDGPNDPLEESFKKIVATINDHAPVRAVVLDTDFNINYPKLLRAELYLKNDPDCLLIAGATDKLLHAKRGFILIGPGLFLNVLEQGTGRQAVALGKPGTTLAAQVLDHYAIEDPRRVLFVGDMPEQDMLFATRCGFQKLLVLSGGTNLDDMLKLTDPECTPDYYADSLADLGKLFE